MIVLGILYVLYGGFRYYRLLMLVNKKLFAASRLGIAFFFAGSCAVVIFIAVIVAVGG